MIVCDKCKKTSDEDHELVPIDIAIMTAGGTALYKGSAVLCADCLEGLAYSIGTPEMVLTEPPKDFSAPITRPVIVPDDGVAEAE